MEGLGRLINYSIHSSVRGFIRWTEILINPRGFPSDYSRALAPALQLDFPSQQIPPSIRRNDDDDEGEDSTTDPKSWSGFLWGVPKKRTSQMKRLRRRFGHTDYAAQCKLLKPKTNLRICDTCGHHHEAFRLCGHCYERIKKETQLIREQADAQFGHGPEDKGIIVLYESDNKQDFNNSGMKRQNDADKNIIVEMPTSRPNFFSGNLLQRSTLRSNPDAKSVIPQAPTPIVHTTKE